MGDAPCRRKFPIQNPNFPKFTSRLISETPNRFHFPNPFSKQYGILGICLLLVFVRGRAPVSKSQNGS
ncbi:hypothetical protein AKJ16_DCAP25899 [Drosera capensis]